MTTTESRPHNVAAIIVTYHPNIEILERLISVLIADRILTIVVDNGGGRAATPQPLLQNGFKLVDLGGNQGIGAAINAGIAEARKACVTHVVMFDQDSSPSPGMVEVLVAEFDRQAKQGIKIGAVGPLFVDRRQNPPLVHPFVRLGVFGSGHRYCASDADLITVDTLITSGCVTSLDVLNAVGLMNQGYFVDYTDLEWSFRAKSRGFVLLGVCRAQMTHELGHGEARRTFGINLFEYSPIRRYYYARNTIAVACLRYVPIRWKVRLLVGLLFRCLTLPWAPRTHGKSLRIEGRMLFRGVLDGLRGVRGPLNNADVCGK